MKTFICPNCGLDVPIKAKACPHCGSDENTGWSDKTYLDGLDLYDESDYEDTIRKEFDPPIKSLNAKGLVFVIIALFLLTILILRWAFRL